MGSRKKPDEATEGGAPETAPPAPAEDDLEIEAYPSARFIHGAFHPRYDEDLIKSPLNIPPPAVSPTR